jgi:hypothetical protein
MLSIIASLLLLIPAVYGCIVLIWSRIVEWKAEQITDPNRRDLKAAEARNLASASSLLPTVLLILLAIGLVLQVYLHVDQYLNLPIDGDATEQS